MPKRWRSLLAGGLTLVTTLSVTFSSAAQVDTSVRISPPDTQDFPTVRFFLSASGGDGRRIEGLTPSSVRIIEDGTSLQPDSVEEVGIGTRQLFIVNTNEGMGVRDSRGRSRFHFVREALVQWWTGAEAAQFAADDLIVVTGAGPLVEHSQTAAVAAAALDGHEPSFDAEITNFDLLLQSLSYLEDPGPKQRAPSFVFFCTSMIRGEEELALTNAIARANELGAAIHPILIDNPEIVQEDGYQRLERLAEATGGQVILLDRADPQLTNLADRILSQRTQYQVSYQSGVTETGFHELQAQVTGEGLVASSEARSFQVDVSAPEVTFVQPPTDITRRSDDPSTPVEALPPTDLTVQLLVTFPDGHSRSVVRSQLLMDGEVIAERTAPPFNSLRWDLNNLRQDQTVQLQAVIQDSLGLEGRSLAHPVQVEVVPPPSGLAALRPALGSLLLILAALLVGAVATVVLFAYSRDRGAAEGDLGHDRAYSPRPLDRASLQGSDASSPEAWLIPLKEEGAEGRRLPLTGADITLGNDASLVTFPFSEPSLSGLHARLIRQAGGRYLLRDQGSVAGTWVNYDPVPDEGVTLRHGDVIHLGRLTLRFQLPKLPEGAEIRVEVLDQSDSHQGHHQEAL